MTIYKASKHFGIPKQTLGDRKSGKLVAPEKSGSGKKPFFYEADEQKLVDHIAYLATIGYAFSRADIVNLASDYAHFLGILPYNKNLSNGWLSRFLDRWAELKLIRSTDLYQDKYASHEELQTYFSELKTIMDKYELHDKPHCIYSFEEMGINIGNKSGKLIALKGSCIRFKSKSAMASVVACGNAVGTYMPPFIMFKGKDQTDELSEKCTSGTEVRMSDNGWSTNILFMDFLKNHFLECCMGCDSDHKLLLFDGHARHIDIGQIEWAKANKIILFLLPPRICHLTKSLDFDWSGQFKKQLDSECEDFMQQPDADTITKYNLGEIISIIYPKVLSAENLTSSFKRTGVYPFNATIIDNHAVSP